MGTRTRSWRAVVGLAGLATVAVLGLGPRSEAMQERRLPNLILISMDTTRADALSCYGHPPGVAPDEPVTPNLDALAARGSRFAAAYAHAPTTLSSHASMMTGLDPHGHQIPRNGFPLDPAIPTLAERLEGAGYHTAAVVGAAALEQAMGLSRGFATYDDQLVDKFGPMVQDRADRVLTRALEAVDARDPDKPLFLFAHFYDPHAPYDAPDDARRRFVDPAYTGPLAERPYQIRPIKVALRDGVADPADLRAATGLYLGEVAYMDAHIGQLLDGLDARGLLDHAVVVAVADHGEMLHERAVMAWSHGYDVYDETARVPLIVAGHGWPLPRGRVVDRQVALSGLAPTLERLVGLDATLGDRRDFAELLALGPVADAQGWPDHPTRTVFSEATRFVTDEHPAWNNLHLMRSVRAGGAFGWGWPASGRALTAPTEPALTPTLQALMRRWDDAAPPHRDEVMADSTREALRALGYIDEDD